jgi:hypothetical protein
LRHTFTGVGFNPAIATGDGLHVHGTQHVFAFTYTTGDQAPTRP